MGVYKPPCLSISFSGQIGFWEHDIEASRIQGRATGRKGERKKYLSPYRYLHVITFLHLYFCILRPYRYIHAWLTPFRNKSSIKKSTSVLWKILVWPKGPLAQDPRKTCTREMVSGQVPPVQVLQEVYCYFLYDLKHKIGMYDILCM